MGTEFYHNWKKLNKNVTKLKQNWKKIETKLNLNRIQIDRKVNSKLNKSWIKIKLKLNQNLLEIESHWKINFI